MPSWKVALSPSGQTAAWEKRARNRSGKLEVELFICEVGDEPFLIAKDAGEPALSSESCVFVKPDSDGVYQIYLYNFRSREIRQLTAGNDDSLEPDISDDGSRIVFTSYATDLGSHDKNGTSDVFLYDVVDQSVTGISTGGDGPSYNPCISGNGETVAFASMAANLLRGRNVAGGNVFVWDFQTEVCEVMPFSENEDRRRDQGSR